MEVKNAVLPTNDQIKGFGDQSSNKSLYMSNLLTFKEKANYPDKSKTSITGSEDYAI